MAFTAWGVSYLTECYGISVVEAGSITFWYPVGMALSLIHIYARGQDSLSAKACKYQFFHSCFPPLLQNSPSV